MLLSGNAVFSHPVFASGSSGSGTPTPAAGAFATPTFTPNMNCPQPPTNIDHATLSDAELDKYQLPHYQPGKDKAAWQARVRAMKHHICSGTSTNHQSAFASSLHSNNSLAPRMSPSCGAYNIGSDIWAGNETVNQTLNSNCTQHNTYIEADAVFYVPCIASGSPTGAEASWVGLGGQYNNNLVQAGTEADVDYFLGVPLYTYYAWTENLAASNRNQIKLFNVNCGDRMQVYIYHSDETYIHDWTNGDYNDTTTGPVAATNSAEWIVERTTINGTPQPLDNFQSETFYGMATTLGTNDYVSPVEVDHGYTTMGGRVHLGSLVYNTSWGPPDYANTISWAHS